MTKEVHRDRLQRLLALAKQAAKPTDRPASARTRRGENAYLLDEHGRPVRSRVRRRISYLCEAYGLEWLRAQLLHDWTATGTRDLDDDELYVLALHLETAVSMLHSGENPEQLFERFL